MTEIKFRSSFDVTLIDSMGNDQRICEAARVSTKGTEAPGTEESEGLINFLITNRHSSTLEHCHATFFINSPIFVNREFFRHRTFQFNEVSTRYKQMEPVFYIPDESRALVQTGKVGSYQFIPGNFDQYQQMYRSITNTTVMAYEAYLNMLEAGIAKEVARQILPLNLYSSFYVTGNLRNWMHFLSLRTKHEDAKVVSYPLYEINVVADQIEALLKELFPIAMKTFNKIGRDA